MSTKQASLVLFARIAEAALREFGRDDLYVAQTPVGMGLGDMHLDLLQQLEEDRLDDAASVAQLVEISRIVDCIQRHPGGVSTPDQDPGYLSDVFPQLIENVEFLPAPLSDDKRRQYEQAQAILFKESPLIKTPAYQEFCLLRADLEKQDIALTEMRLKLKQLEASAERDMLQSELATLEQLFAEKREALAALDKAHSFSAAEEIVAAAECHLDQVPTSIRSVLETMELFQITDPISNVTHVGCSFFPSHLAEDNWTPLKLTRKDIAHGKNDGGSSTSDADELNDHEIDTIELEVQTLVCERPWLWPALFTNRQWGWSKPSPPISTENDDAQADSLIPAYIHALIFARNLTVRARLSAESLKAVEGAQVDPTSSLLMRAIKSTQALPQRQFARLPTQLRTHKVAPLASHSVVPTTATSTQPLGINLVRQPIGGKRSSRTTAARPGSIRNLAVQGRVVDEQGRGIFNAKVTLIGNVGQRSVTTGKDGSFIFISVPRGRFRVRVEKTNFKTVTRSGTVPQTTPQTIQMQQVASCQVEIRLRLDDGQPFAGTAKILIQSAAGSSLECLDGCAQASFSLPPGPVNVIVTSPQAERISPPRATLMLNAKSSTLQAITFTIVPAPVLRNPEVQLLGFVCRRVPFCPDP